MPTPSTPTGAAVLGADPDELDRAASRLRAAADELDGSSASLTATLRSVAWVGGVATRFTGHWHGSHRPRVASTSQFLREAAGGLTANAAEQRAASASGRSAAPGPAATPGPTTAPAGDHRDTADDLERRLGQVEATLGQLGTARADLATVADHLRQLAEHGAADRIIDLLNDDTFVQLLKTAEVAIDAGEFVVDLLQDVVDHPELPLDERIVHALADASLRFGVEEGIEHGVTFLTATVTTALVPAFGALLAPVVSRVAGELAGALAGEAFEALDDAVDVVDWGADRAVDVYQDIKDSLGLLIDVGAAAVDVAGSAVDLAGDAVDWLDDRAGDLADAVDDLASDVGGAVLGGLGGLGGLGSWLGG
ncbi:MAG: hypothetical protein QNJ12_15110 [Ilumatobacter sp.]|uniref:hypothetical protein n=1 Tax=Ilumatobacter sp. TaxID=1967498 RepID=UPI00261A6A7E|nr:hypothetical protein [Ilumatobacter sp.]MDJ0770129.1 hypothetical protein [Ilumatobacter sp.]